MQKLREVWEIGSGVFIDLIGGISATLLISFLFKLNFSALFYLFGISAALFPDVDFLIRFLVEGKVLDAGGVFHRDYLHYPFWIIIIFGGFFYFYLGLEHSLLFMLGVLYHFIHDSIGGGYGVFWLWPFSKLRYQFYPPRSYTRNQIINEIEKNQTND
ncbi:MAG: hypothetical protein UT37_C0001G0025 [Parcubacteria group bacterium GW2011_GWA2_39_18]|nr:MAG: hypothetical protein UT37_C0001G0025 [Parcubacteria group bacterium GW2011_GWA2_39_18]